MGRNADIYWINLVLEGNINAFRNIVDLYKDRAFNLALKICNNREEAEEILQDSFLKAFRSLAEFRKESSFKTWFYRIVFNTSISHLRTKRTGITFSDVNFAENTDYAEFNTYEYISESEYNKALINHAFKTLGDDEKGIISMFYYDELSIAEIADITGESVSNIKVKLHRSRKRMSDALTRIKTGEISVK